MVKWIASSSATNVASMEVRSTKETHEVPQVDSMELCTQGHAPFHAIARVSANPVWAHWAESP